MSLTLTRCPPRLSKLLVAYWLISIIHATTILLLGGALCCRLPRSRLRNLRREHKRAETLWSRYSK